MPILRGVLGKGTECPRINLHYHPYARERADGQAVVCPLLLGRSPTRGVAPKQHWVIFGLALSLNPLARGCRRIWRGEIWKYGFGGAVADLGLLISGSRRRPRRSQLRGQLRHDRSQQLAEGATASFLSGIFGLALSLNPLARGCRGRKSVE